jgi:hypothetical protein
MTVNAMLRAEQAVKAWHYASIRYTARAGKQLLASGSTCGKISVELDKSVPE